MNYTQCGSALALPYADGIAQTCVTSPPYYGLRDYGTARWEGGDAGCDHRKHIPQGENSSSTLRPEGKPHHHLDNENVSGIPYRDTCGKCGARRIDAQIGLEQTPAAYVAQIVAAMREVWRVLRDDGTLWLNLGDSYASTAPGTRNAPQNYGNRSAPEQWANMRPPLSGNLKPKDLMGIPWAVAKALQKPYYTGRIKSKTDRAWLAGFLDGEGTISFVERDRGEDHTPTHDVRVFITNTARGPLDHFCAMTAGHVYEHDDGKRENRFGDKPCYRWQMGTHDGALLIRELYPFLRVKRKQAALIWTLYTTLRHQNGHARTPSDVVEMRRAIAEMVRALNRGEDVDLPDWVLEPESPTEPGWYLRSDIIWAKPNPMPESVTDRPTKAHEYLFLLAKQPRYFYDAEAIKEKAEYPEDKRRPLGSQGAWELDGRKRGENGGGKAYDHDTSSRNARSVWTIATQPYSGAHFATMPPELARRCILAGSSARGQCPKCGAPWARQMETEMVQGRKSGAGNRAALGDVSPSSVFRTGLEPRNTTTGWAASCDCDAGDPVPQIVLDPFAGSGTTAMVALQNGRRAIGTELNPAYLRLQDDRTQVTMGLGL